MRSGFASATSPICRRSTICVTASASGAAGRLCDHAIAILALSMAASVTAFSVVSQILLRPLPYQEPERIVTLLERHAATRAHDVAPGNFSTGARARRASSSWPASSHTASTTPAASVPKSQGRARHGRASSTSSASSRSTGRFFRPKNTKRQQRVVVLSERFWRAHFNGDPAIVGKTIPLDDGAFLVAGIAPMISSRTSRSTRPAIATLRREGDRGVRAAHPRQRLLERRRTAEGRRLDRTGAGGDGCDRRAHRAGQPTHATRTCAPR
jgi:hypothetical protein